MNINGLLQTKFIDQPKEQFTQEFMLDLVESYPELNKDLFEIKERSHRHVTHAVYDNKFKLISINSIIKLFNSYYDLLDHDNVEREAIHVSDEQIKDCWLKCISSSLFPNIVEDSPGWYKVDYLNDSEYRELTCVDLFHITKNSEKFLEYAELVKDIPVCITDFNLSNFVINKQTNEIFMVDVCDMDYVEHFKPEIFFTDSNDGSNKLQHFFKNTTLSPEWKNTTYRDDFLKISQFNFYICKKLLSQETHSLKTYHELLTAYLGSADEIKSIKFF